MGDNDDIFDTNSDVVGIGNTALHYAAGNGDLAMVRILATAPNAIMNLRNGRGQTPLHYAAGNGHANVIWFFRTLPSRMKSRIVGICEHIQKVVLKKSTV